MVRLYSTHCPKCIMLENKLKQKKVAYELITDFDLEEIKAKGFSSMPLLEVDGEIMEFEKALPWVNKK